MNRLLFFVMLAAIAGTVIYGYFAPDKPPDKALTLTPGEYIQQVEKNKAETKNPGPAKDPTSSGSEGAEAR